MRAICTVLLDPRDPLLQSERTQGFAANPVCVKGEVFAYDGFPQNLKVADILDAGSIPASSTPATNQSHPGHDRRA
jgi:hypothetical protein